NVGRLMQFLVANKIESERRRAVFLSVIGPKAFALLRDLIAPRKKPGESFGDYIASLKGLACTCDFAGSLEEQLRDQFVCGINNQELRRKLLKAASDDGLTWARMLEIRNSFECTTSGMQSMQKGPPSSYLRTDHVGLPGLRGESRNHSGRDCYRCLGKGHGPNDCKFKEFQCHGCGKAGHLERACKNKRADLKSSEQHRSTGKTPARYLPSRSRAEVNFVDKREDLVLGIADSPAVDAGERTDLRLQTLTTDFQGM
ncbi:hypothetical protein M9458_050529, partial [Cirrhinus mrigala]